MTGQRLAYQEAMELVQLPPASPGGSPRFMSRRAAWLPGADVKAEIQRLNDSLGSGSNTIPMHTAAFGGHVYAQAVYAVCRALELEAKAEASTQATPKTKARASKPLPNNLGLHTIHGYFTAVGHSNRTFVYEVSILTRGRSFLTARVEARQPLKPSSQAVPGELDAPGKLFPLGDVIGQPLGFVCFTAIVSFASPRPHSLGCNTQEPPVQERFAPILRTRPPAAWDPSPPVDIDVLIFAIDRRDIVGSFPLVDMKKVDMTAYNAGRPMHERRELILYRLIMPMPEPKQVSSPFASVAALTAADNAHVIVHAYAADRNGLLMIANHLEFPMNEKVASLSNSFVLHCNVDEARMTYRPESETDNDLGSWWVQEACFPRTGAGRSVIINKIWSPSGVHVATEYQDGLCIAKSGPGFSLKL